MLCCARGYACVSGRLCMRVCTDVCMYVCLRACVHACLYVYDIRVAINVCVALLAMCVHCETGDGMGENGIFVDSCFVALTHAH